MQRSPYQLTGGALRYYVDAMTYARGYVNNYQTWSPYYDYDPGLELQRAFEGDEWVFESKASYNIPASNHRGFQTSIYFGDGTTASTYALEFVRQRDIPANSNLFNLRLMRFDPDLDNQTGLDGNQLTLSTDGETWYTRIERSHGLLTAMWSNDGVSWDTALSVDLGSQLNGLEQRLVISGSSWFTPLGSYADYDYVRLTSAVPEPGTYAMVLAALVALAGARRWRHW